MAAQASLIQTLSISRFAYFSLKNIKTETIPPKRRDSQDKGYATNIAMMQNKALKKRPLHRAASREST